MSTPEARKRRPLPSKMVHLKMQAAMPGTLNGDAARIELERLANPTNVPPASTSTFVPEEPIATTQPEVGEDLATSDVPNAAPIATRSRKSVKTPQTPASTTGGTALRLSPDHADELLATRLHYQTVHKEKLSNQGIVASALDFYLAHLRRTGKLPPK